MLGETSGFLLEGREVIIAPKGSSMLPFIQEGRDSVKLKKRDEIKPGDIVLAEISPGHYILHRVYEIEGDTVILMGDGNIRGREKCRREDIRGTVVEIITGNGKTHRPADGRLWKVFLPIRRILLGIYRRIAL